MFVRYNKGLLLSLFSQRMKPLIYILILSLSLFVLSEPIQLFAQEAGEFYLRRGIQKYEELDISGAILDLLRALTLGIKTDEGKIDAYRYLAVCHAESGEKAAAVQYFKNLLEINPSFRLDEDASPLLLRPFNEALSGMDQQPPVIEHQPVAQIESGTVLVVKAEVRDSTGVNEVNLYFRQTGEDVYRSEKMIKGSGDDFQFALAVDIVQEPGVEYYIEAYDVLGNGPATMGTADGPMIVTVIALDRVPPTITHEPISEIEAEQTLDISAVITDDVGVSEANVMFRLQDESDFRSILMRPLSNNVFYTQISSEFVNPPMFHYYITASDESENVGFWKSPNEPYTLTVKTKPSPQIVEVDEKPTKEKRKGRKTWLWISLAAVAVGGGTAILLSKKEPSEGSLVVLVYD